MSDHQHSASTGTARERELEIEVARLQAELDTLRGEDPSATTSRFLAMAAATVDQAVEDARREADEIVEEVSAQAEARRDEATRVAAEAEAMAEELLADADRAQERIDAANEEAEAIKAAAGEEAEALVQSEREKVAVEVEALAEVRTALEDERGALESYHDELRSRVQELAETMVSFMSTELPAGAGSSIESLVTPQLESVIAGNPAPADAAVEESDELDELDEDAELDDASTVFDDSAFEAALSENAVFGESHDDDVDEEAATAADAPEDTDTWTDLLESAIPTDEAYPDAVDMPDDAIDEIPDGPPREFAGHEILEPEIDHDGDDEGERPSSAGLFSRATADETDVHESTDADEPAEESESEPESEPEPESKSSGLFGMLGARLVEQTSPDQLAEALEADESEDEAFHQFLAGDSEPDPSRDWLLRPEQS